MGKLKIITGYNRVWTVLTIASVLIVLIPSHKVHAGLEACTVTITPSSAEAGTDTTFNFDVGNNSSDSIRWLNISSSGGIFSIHSASATGWSAYTNDEDVTFRYGNLPPPYDQGFVVDTGVNTPASSTSWTVQASDDPSGTNPTTCSGDTSVTVGYPPIAVNDVRLSGLTSSSVDVSWTTTAPGTSQVNYGTDNTYGSQTDLNGTPTTSHHATISGLQPNTGYHLQVVSSDSGGHTATSGDFTFLTAATASSGSGSSGSTTIFLGSNSIPLLAKPIEKVPPTVSVSTQIPKVVKTFPKISGVSDDNEAIARVEYSTDGGKNWLPVDVISGLGGKHSTFSFTPLNLEDGNYDLVVRSIDTSANIGTTTPTTVVIDRLPPIVGGNIVSLGPQVLAPDSRGTIASLVGVDQKITLSSVGGATNIEINALHIGSKSKPQTFALTKSVDNGLWSGIISFEKSGKYNLVANSVDGAGNKTTRTLNSVYVFSPAHAYDSVTHRPLRATVTLYYLEPDTHTWVVWDGDSYGQDNPQTADKDGAFNMLLPPGKYYLKASAAGHHTLVSSIFDTSRSKPLSVNLALKPIAGFSIGSLRLPTSLLSVQNITLSDGEVNKQQPSGQGTRVGQQAPDFTLLNTSGQTVHAAGLLGKPTLLSFGSTWSPTTVEQLPALSKLQQNKELNIIPVAIQESSSKVKAYTDIAGLNLTWLVDPDSTTSTTYGIQSLPTNFFLDRQGVVRQVIVGVMTEQQIINTLSGL